jgi:hypothetical protein
MNITGGWYRIEDGFVTAMGGVLAPLGLRLDGAKLAAVPSFPDDPQLGERLFFLTDHRAYVWDGTSWNRIG